MSLNKSPISFFIPAFNCQDTVAESVESVMNGNFRKGDELIIVNDGSTDGTGAVLEQLRQKYSRIILLNHAQNLGGGAARNTAVSNSCHSLLFCLDSDNVLAPESVPMLKEKLISSRADAACFGEVRFFVTDPSKISFNWVFNKKYYNLQDYLSTIFVPGSSGNYLFNKDSWARVSGYPETVYACDTWGFGFRQAATGVKMITLPNTFYYHRCGYESYWVREARERNISHLAFEVMKPYLHLIDDEDVLYIQNEGRDNWFDNLEERPLWVKADR